ncbi:hypothetical protein KP509_36G009500 [Ceratopteris richardii]|uniref:CoA carboxyltransferase C-terminal domain-containing protein n=1 Tax=Ceratopteris richardii TaxID=49495 RepID=A0A8T2QBT4_CERRI|nr:hypothetical protein KP509_36G009500 [Ceratopteris richardii]
MSPVHEDRVGFDDPAIISGIDKIGGMSFMCIGHQKARQQPQHLSKTVWVTWKGACN